jgi:cellulose synthase/poly-beta-1,6-N-acetylglucosamine synthase-like glycosyltransferase
MITEITLILLGFLFVGFAIIFVLVFRYSKFTVVKKDYSFTPTISIVIPTMNEEKIIENRLHNILQMDYPHDKMEVVFVDNSKDSTPQIITKYAAEYPFFKLLKQEKKGFNNALNQGYSAATGEIVIKSDCTALPQPNAIREAVANLSDKTIGAVCGVHMFSADQELEKEFKGVMYQVQLMESFLHSSLISHGSFGAFRKILQPTLPEEITADDSEVVVSVVRHGYRAIIDPAIKSAEEAPKGFKERRSQKNRRAAGVIRVLLQNIDMVFNRKYGKFGMVTLPIDLFLLVISPLVLFTLCVLWVVNLAITPSMPLLVSTLIVGSFAAVSIAFSSKVRAVADTYVSCFIGVFQSVSKKKAWK